MTILFASNIERALVIAHYLHYHHWKFKHRDRIGIVGVNGAGKSTLLQILSKNRS